LAGLIQGRDGALYGTTSDGGAGDGTIFKVDLAGGLTTLHSFTGDDGAAPAGVLLQTRDGALYGTAQLGGSTGDGVVFRMAVVTPTTTATPIPGTIEAEDYDGGGQGVGYADTTPGNEGGGYRHDDVDIKPSVEGGYAIGWFAAGEWLAYTVNVERDGVYVISARVGSALPDRTFRIEADGQDVTGPIAVPQVADWDRFETVRVPGVRLHAGIQRLRVVMGPLDFMDFQRLTITRRVLPHVEH
jgi:uncharacterized repeat protein (TIGR03803 family)